MKNKVLLVGGTGYIGKELSQFISDEYDVYITGTKFYKKLNYFQLDLSLPKTFESIKNLHFDLILFLASSIKGLGDTSLINSDLRINTVEVGAFLDFIKKYNISKKIICFSSMTVYKASSKLPVTEHSKLEPTSSYALSKVINESFFNFLSRNSEIKVLVLRLPGIYGGSRKGGIIYNVAKKASTNEEIILDLYGLGFWECMEINDLCISIKCLLSSYTWKKKYQIINVSYGHQIDLINTIKYIIKKLESSTKLLVKNRSAYANFFMSNKKLDKMCDIKISHKKSLDNFLDNLS